MAEPIYVNLHTHTLHSDGVLTPEALAEKLAGAGVRYAALADHDTVAGWPAFSEALDARGVSSLPGIELTTQHRGRILHLVAYGFDPEDIELRATLASMRQHRGVDSHSIEGSLRAAGTPPATAADRAASSAPDGELETGAAIALLHRAGGRAFLAHPLVYERDIAELEHLVAELASVGLDGLEAIYQEFAADDREALRQLARRHDLLVSAGTDYHGVKGLGSSALGIEMPSEEWLRFRAAVLDGPGLAQPAPAPRPPDRRPVAATDHAGGAGRFRRRSFVLRIVLPAVAAMALVLLALWGLLLPSFEQTLIERKREMIRELTNSAWSVLAAYEADERAGLLTREEAQAAAAAVVGELRYGEDRLDYFWIQDTAPTMVMHPYRTDLDGEDLSGFTDPRGVPIFVEFADLVETEDEGYVDYVWQWFDDPARLEPKESYVKGFEPWDWVIGTGLYTDDVRAEIARIERDLILAGLGISGLIGLLLLVVLQQSLRIERRREESVDRLRDSNARYHALVEATSEGTLLVIDGRLRYANPTFLQLLGYSARQLDFLELADILPRGAGNDDLWAALETGASEAVPHGVARDGVLTRSDGSTLECVLTLEPVEFGGQSGSILLARDVTAAATAPSDTSALGASVGVFRAVAARRGVFVDLSPAGHELLELVDGAENEAQPALADCFADAAEYGRFHRRLLDDGEVRDHVLTIESTRGSRSILLSAALVRDEEGQPSRIDGLLVDVTAARDEAAGREVQQLRASLLFLHESVGSLRQEAIVVDLEATVEQAALQMTERGATAALVSSPSGSVIGIVTDHDIRARVVAQRVSLAAPLETIMTAPLVRIAETVPVYEALWRMEEAGVGHLAVEDAAGGIIGVVDHDVLIRAPRYAPLVLLRDIARADSVAAVARRCERALPVAAGLIESSARPRHVNSTLTSILDAATVRLIRLALAELGPAPVTFAFFAMGSQGRGEVHLLSDQDHGIVFDDIKEADGDPEAVTSYFRRLGTFVSDGLQAAGYPYCRGRVMASDAAWCRSLSGWLAAYDGWLRRAEPQDITDLSIFLDFRLVHGDAALTSALQRHVHETLPLQRGVQYQLVRNALTFRPPLRLPGNIYLGGAAEQAGRIDLKDALQPIVAFARVGAARHRIDGTHTLDRISALTERELLPPGSGREIADAYDFLMGLRLQTQLADRLAGRDAGNSIDQASLTRTGQELLRAAFAQIGAVQKTAESEFPEVT